MTTAAPSLPHYEARRMSGGWGFTTPSGQVSGFLTEKRAELIAALQERQDREEAAGDSMSPVTQALRKHFSTQDMP